MADFDKIKRNVSRMVEASAPEADIDAYLGTEGVTPDQLRAAPKGSRIDRTFGGDKDAQKQYEFAKKSQSSFSRRVLDSATFGGADEVLAGLGAAVATPFGNKTLGENYDQQLQVQRALRDDAREGASGAAGVAADLTGGFMMLPGRVASAAAPIVAEGWRQGLGRIGGEVVRNAPNLAKVGAAYGAGAAFAGTDGSSDPNATLFDNASARLSAVPGGAVEGAAGAVLLGGALQGALGVRNLRNANKVDRIQRQQLNALDWQADGQTVPGYLVTESPSAQATARGLSDSVLGGSIRNDAAARTADLEARARQTIREQTGGLPSSDLGEAAQTMLRRNLHEYTIPNNAVREMPNAALEDIAGNVTAEGFRPPRPTVQPVQPRDVPDVTPEQFAREGLPPRVPPTEPQFNPPARRDFGDFPPEIAVKDMDLQLRTANFNNRYNTGGSKGLREVPVSLPTTRQQIEADAIASRHDALLAKYADDFPELKLDSYVPSPALRLGMMKNPAMAADLERMQRLRKRHDELQKFLGPMREEHAALFRDRAALAAEMEAYADRAFKQRAKDAHAKALEEAQADTLRRNAAAETAARREQARREAEAQTQAARDEADRLYNEDMATSSNGFRVGRTRESYPTEFAAGYELTSRNTPAIQRNILGGKNETGRTATEGLLYDFASQARRQNQAAGYRDGQLFGVDGSVMHPGVSRYLERMLGPDIAGQIQTYAARRAKGGFNPGIDGIRDLRTAVRRAAQDAERPMMPGESRSTDAAMLRRLEGALSADMHAFMNAAGEQGQRASQMMRGVDDQYRQVAETLRAPLARIYGEKVAPVDAMNRLGKAATDGDLRALSAFMRVAREKGNPNQAASSIVAHLTDGGRNIGSFLDGFRAIPAESRNIMFQGAEGRALRASLERLERKMAQLEPYQTPIARGGGVDFSRRSNLVLGMAAISNVYATATVAGGLGLVSRFMASPRYVNWLTTLPRSSDRAWSGPEARAAIGRLMGIAQSDSDRERGREIIKAFKDAVLPSAAQAAPLSPADRATITPLTEKVLFAGENSKTADKAALGEAKQMDAAGAPAGEQWRKSGWAKAEDGKWRYEIDDSGSELTDLGFDMAKLAQSQAKYKQGFQAKLETLIDHPEMFKAFPKLKDVTVQMFTEDAYPAIKNFWAYMDVKNNRMVINATKAANNPDVLKSAILHEAQHAVQGASKLFYGRAKGLGAGYEERPGEVEAYDVEARMKMNPAQRRANVPALIERGKQLEWAK